MFESSGSAPKSMVAPGAFPVFVGNDTDSGRSEAEEAVIGLPLREAHGYSSHFEAPFPRVLTQSGVVLEDDPLNAGRPFVLPRPHSDLSASRASMFEPATVV